MMGKQNRFPMDNHTADLAAWVLLPVALRKEYHHGQDVHGMIAWQLSYTGVVVFVMSSTCFFWVVSEPSWITVAFWELSVWPACLFLRSVQQDCASDHTCERMQLTVGLRCPDLAVCSCKCNLMAFDCLPTLWENTLQQLVAQYLKSLRCQDNWGVCRSMPFMSH